MNIDKMSIEMSVVNWDLIESNNMLHHPVDDYENSLDDDEDITEDITDEEIVITENDRLERLTNLLIQLEDIDHTFTAMYDYGRLFSFKRLKRLLKDNCYIIVNYSDLDKYREKDWFKTEAIMNGDDTSYFIPFKYIY